MALKKKADGTVVRVIEKEVTADEILADIQKVKRNIESNKSQTKLLNDQLVEFEANLAELTEIYKQLI